MCWGGGGEEQQAPQEQQIVYYNPYTGDTSYTPPTGPMYNDFQNLTGGTGAYGPNNASQGAAGLLNRPGGPMSGQSSANYDGSIPGMNVINSQRNPIQTWY